MGVVYLLADSLKEGYYKIGVTKGSVEKRIKKLQTGNAGEIYLVNSFETDHPYVMEKILHTKYFGERKIGEWFELGLDDVTGFEENCKKIQETINALKDNYFFQKKYNKNLSVIDYGE